MFWVLMAVMPGPLIMLAESKAGMDVARFVMLWVNPTITMIACYFMFDTSNRGKIYAVAGGVFVGAIFAVMNIVVFGLVGGCTSGALMRDH